MSCSLPWGGFKFVTDVDCKQVQRHYYHSLQPPGVTPTAADPTAAEKQPASWESKIASLADDAAKGYLFEVLHAYAPPPTLTPRLILLTFRSTSSIQHISMIITIRTR